SGVPPLVHGGARPTAVSSSSSTRVRGESPFWRPRRFGSIRCAFGKPVKIPISPRYGNPWRGMFVTSMGNAIIAAATATSTRTASLTSSTLFVTRLGPPLRIRERFTNRHARGHAGRNQSGDRAPNQCQYQPGAQRERCDRQRQCGVEEEHAHECAEERRQQ